ncbi:MAG: hypothetical protein AMXMBFR48_02810 [Ignavibacteriales bacterium]
MSEGGTVKEYLQINRALSPYRFTTESVRVIVTLFTEFSSVMKFLKYRFSSSLPQIPAKTGYIKEAFEDGEN